MNDIPAHERPRELLATRGADSLTSAQLIAIILRTGTKGRPVVHIAEELVATYKSLTDLAAVSLEELTKFKGIGIDKAVTLKAAFVLAKRMSEELRYEQPKLTSPDKVVECIRFEFQDRNVENLGVACLDTRRHLIKFQIITQGTLDTIVVHPREIFRVAIMNNASAIILVHNHPSGDPTPSEGDIRTTRDLIRAGQLLKIEVLDHIIIGKPTSNKPVNFASLKALGYF